MNWIESEGNSFIYSDQGRVRRKRIEFKSLFGVFEVFQVVSGKFFYRHPFMTGGSVGPLGNNIGPGGMDNGTTDWFGEPRKPCKDIEEGKAVCEQVMLKIKELVNSY